jgi:hypothetical protein
LLRGGGRRRGGLGRRGVEGEVLTELNGWFIRVRLRVLEVVDSHPCYCKICMH